MSGNEHIIDLDMSPSERWQPVIAAYENELSEFGARFDEALRLQIGSASKAFFLFEWVARCIQVPDELKQEMESIATLTRRYGLTYGKILFMNVFLDVSDAAMACTSVVFQESTRGMHHLRTLDWELAALRPLVARLNFKRNGVTLYKSVSILPCIGVLTGMRSGAFSLSYNFRKKQSGGIKDRCKAQAAFLLDLVKKSTSASFGPFMSFVLRDVLEQTTSFDDAVQRLKAAPCRTQCYLTVCGTRPGEGIVLVNGDPKGEMQMQGSLLVQTNHDPGMTKVDTTWAGNDPNLLTTLLRTRQLCDTVKQDSSLEDAQRQMLTPPIFNKDTMFMCTMSAAHDTMIIH